MTLLGERDVTRQQFAASTVGADGRSAAGATTTTTIRMSVQVLSNRDLRHLAELNLTRVTAKGYTETAGIFPGDEATARQPDRIVDGGTTYEVRTAGIQHPLITHSKVYLFRLNQAGGEA